jgi:hypothetical protein
VLLLLWLATSIGVYIAASQDWYAVIKPSATLSRVAATGLESFPLLATIPWVSLLCLLLIWYLGSIGRVLVAGITALLALAGVAQLALQSINAELIISKVENSTGIRHTIEDLLSRTEQLWPRYLTIALLVMLAAVALLSIFIWKRSRRTPTTLKSGLVEKGRSKPDSRELWDEQNHQ